MDSNYAWSVVAAGPSEGSTIMAHLCHVRHDDAYLVVVLDPALDMQWGMPHDVMWANPGANPATNDPILLQPTQNAGGAPISRSEHEILVMVPPYKQLYGFLERRGVPTTYQGEIDDAGRLRLSPIPDSSRVIHGL